MPERDGYVPGVPCSVDTSQPDPEAALPFYGGLFGWEFEDPMPASGTILVLVKARGWKGWGVAELPESAWIPWPPSRCCCDLEDAPEVEFADELLVTETSEIVASLWRTLDSLVGAS